MYECLCIGDLEYETQKDVHFKCGKSKRKMMSDLRFNRNLIVKNLKRLLPSLDWESIIQAIYPQGKDDVYLFIVYVLRNVEHNHV